MAKEQLHNLKKTDSLFQLRGKVVGVKSQNFYKGGTGKNGGAWNKMQFGIQIAPNKTVYVTLNGYTRPEVFFYAKGENGAKGTTKRVAWKDRLKDQGAGFRLIGINISVDKDEEGNNINKTFTEYDAVEHLHTALKGNEDLFIRGTIEFSSYTDRTGQTKRSINLVPNQISFTQQPIDFDAEGYKPMAEFENTLVFSSIDQEEDENSKATGRFILSGYSINFNSIENVSFIIDAEHKAVATAIKKRMKPGNSIKTYGRIVVENHIEEVEAEDDGWGSKEKSPLERQARVNGPTTREYVVYKVDGDTFDTETYSEKEIAAALKKIKAAKEAVANFGDKPTSKPNIDIEVEDSWNSGSFDDEDMDW